MVCKNRWRKLSVRTCGEWSVGTGGESDLKEQVEKVICKSRWRKLSVRAGGESDL